MSSSLRLRSAPHSPKKSNNGFLVEEWAYAPFSVSLSVEMEAIPERRALPPFLDASYSETASAASFSFAAIIFNSFVLFIDVTFLIAVIAIIPFFPPWISDVFLCDSMIALIL